MTRRTGGAAAAESGPPPGKWRGCAPRSIIDRLGGRSPAQRCRSSGVEAEGSPALEAQGGAGAALTTTRRAGTARRPGLGKQGGKVYERNQRQSSSIHLPAPKPGGFGPVLQRTSHGVGGLGSRMVPSGQEAMGKACGVPMAMLQGQSWAPRPPTGCVVNVGTLLGPPSPPVVRTGDGQACRRLLAPEGGGGPVVVRGRESRPHGEGGQQACRAGTGRSGGRR